MAAKKKSNPKSKDVLDSIRELLWPGGDLEHEWDSDTLDDVANVVSEIPPDKTPEGRMLVRIREVLWPSEFPWHEWDSDTLGEIANILQRFDTAGPQRSVSSTSSASTDDLETIARHRTSLGMPKFDASSGWTTEEIAKMAESIRTTGRMTNPQMDKSMRMAGRMTNPKLKRSLMR